MQNFFCVGENIAWNVNFLQILIINYVHCQKLCILLESVAISKYKIRYEKPFFVTNLSVSLMISFSKMQSVCNLLPLPKKDLQDGSQSHHMKILQSMYDFQRKDNVSVTNCSAEFRFFMLSSGTHAPWSIPQVTFSYLIYIHEHQGGSLTLLAGGELYVVYKGGQNVLKWTSL